MTGSLLSLYCCLPQRLKRHSYRVLLAAFLSLPFIVSSSAKCTVFFAP